MQIGWERFVDFYTKQICLCRLVACLTGCSHISKRINLHINQMDCFWHWRSLFLLLLWLDVIHIIFPFDFNYTLQCYLLEFMVKWVFFLKSFDRNFLLIKWSQFRNLSQLRENTRKREPMFSP